MSQRRRQELYCHACDKNVQFVIDLELDGNHVLNCPNCNHEHCRVVKEGFITDDRWDQRNGPTWQIASSVTTWTNNVTITAGSTTFYANSLFISGSGYTTTTYTGT